MDKSELDRVPPVLVWPSQAERGRNSRLKACKMAARTAGACRHHGMVLGMKFTCMHFHRKNSGLTSESVRMTMLLMREAL